MNKQIIATNEAPAAIGPYSQAVRAGDTLYISGQIPANPATGELASGIEAQARQVFDNIAAILRAAGAGFDSVVKTTVLLAHMSDFAAVNAVYAEYFSAPFPARACFAVASLPKGALIEAEAVAWLG